MLTFHQSLLKHYHNSVIIGCSQINNSHVFLFVTQAQGPNLQYSGSLQQEDCFFPSKPRLLKLFTCNQILFLLPHHKLFTLKNHFLITAKALHSIRMCLTVQVVWHRPTTKKMTSIYKKK